jgi:four helix bundle protein
MQDFKNLTVWHAARRLTKLVYQMTALFPESERFGLSSQMRRASISICSNIAEGCGRRGDVEFRRFLSLAMASACELESELILCLDLSLIAAPQQQGGLRILIEVKRMLGGLINRLSDPTVNPRRRSADS